LELLQHPILDEVHKETLKLAHSDHSDEDDVPLVSTFDDLQANLSQKFGFSKEDLELEVPFSFSCSCNSNFVTQESVVRQNFISFHFIKKEFETEFHHNLLIFLRKCTISLSIFYAIMSVLFTLFNIASNPTHPPFAVILAPLFSTLLLLVYAWYVKKVVFSNRSRMFACCVASVFGFSFVLVLYPCYI
jgi:hypothetical protein